MTQGNLKAHETEATLFSATSRILGAAGYSDLKFDIGGKKSRRRYVSALEAQEREVKIWVKSSRHWPGKADAILFPWKKYKDADAGYHSILYSCESAKAKGVTHLLAVVGDGKTGELFLAQLYSIEDVPEIAFQQSEMLSNSYYRTHSSALIVASYTPDFDDAAALAANTGKDLLSIKNDNASNQENVQETRVVRRSGRAYKRDRRVREAVLALAEGICECCGEIGFEMENGSRYLETHHVIEVSARGPDDMSNVVAICPNCHRKAHYSMDRLAIEREMIAAIRRHGRRNA